MDTNILLENQNKRRDIPKRLLICFALYCTWQMGVIYFSGTTLSFDGRTPLPVNVGNVTLLIAGGYILSICFMCISLGPYFIIEA